MKEKPSLEVAEVNEDETRKNDLLNELLTFQDNVITAQNELDAIYEARNAKIVEAHKVGLSMQEIGQHIGVSRQIVHKVITRESH